MKPRPNLYEDVVGVFNVDAVTADGAEWLHQNQAQLGAFLQLGKVLALLA